MKLNIIDMKTDIFLPGFQLHPTFSGQPPINGVKTWLVKKCTGQHSAACLFMWVKTTFLETCTHNASVG